MNRVECLSADSPPPVHPDLVAVVTTLREKGLLPVVQGDVQRVRSQLERINVWAAHRSVPLSYERTLGFAGVGRTVPCTLSWPEG
ncbi:alpha/beta hydrolase, partial [Pseudomonas ogarae]